MGCLKQFLRKGPAPVVEIVATVKQPKTIQQSKQPRKKMRWAPQPKPRQEDVDWQKVAREENAYLRKARGLTASPKFVRGGGCSPR